MMSSGPAEDYEGFVGYDFKLCLKNNNTLACALLKQSELKTKLLLAIFVQTIECSLNFIKS